MLYNKTQKKKIIEKVRIAEGFFGKFKGLMFEGGKNFDYALVFDFWAESRISARIHMLFVFFPIDAIFLNAKKEVVDIARLQPFALNYTPKKAAKFVIELRAGKASGIKINDVLEW